MAKQILMNTDLYYENPEGIMEEGDGSEAILAKVTVSDTWYASKKDLLPEHNELIQDGDDIKAISCTL